MSRPTLVFCAGGSRRNTAIALEHGFRYGARLPSTVHAPLYFADQDWKRPVRDTYVRAVAKHRPTMATVLDWEREEQLAEVLGWAEDVAPHVELVQLIPKVIGGASRLPRAIGGRPIVLGYSAATSYGGTAVPIWEFAGWPVHILGGSPHRQMLLWRYLSAIADVVSIDGNVMQKLARRGCFWSAQKGRHGHWVSVREADGFGWAEDTPYEALRRSCVNVVEAWGRLT